MSRMFVTQMFCMHVLNGAMVALNSGDGFGITKNSSWEWGICKKSGLKHIHSVSNTQKLMYSNLESPLLGLAVWITVDSKRNTENRRWEI